MPEKLLPFTAMASVPLGFGPQISIGKKRYFPPREKGKFWIAAFDRAKIEAGPILSIVQESSVEIPPGLKPYLTNQNLLCVVSRGMQLNDVPQGEFYQFLISQGANKALRTLEQLFVQIGSGQIKGAAYCLVTTPGTGGEGFEAHELINEVGNAGDLGPGFTRQGAILPLSLKLQDAGGTPMWFPVNIGE